LGPHSETYRVTLGVAQYRIRRFQYAVETLARCNQNDGASPTVRAFLAMAHYRLGHTDQARSLLNELRSIAREARWLKDEHVQESVREAEQLIGGDSLSKSVTAN
jgi:Tetratricopeptide repeat